MAMRKDDIIEVNQGPRRGCVILSNCSPGGLVKTRIPGLHLPESQIQRVWGGTCESVFLTRSWVGADAPGMGTTF